MTARDVINDALMFVKDPGRVNFSNAQLLLLLNEAQVLLGEHLGKTPSTILETHLELELEDGVADIPDNFVSVRRVLAGDICLDVGASGDNREGTFRIERGQIRAPGQTSVDLFYWRTPSRVVSEDADLEFPDSLRSGLRKILTASMEGDVGAPDMVASAVALGVVPRERRGRAAMRVPFYV